MGECGTERLEPKISDNGTVVRGERRASLVRGLALPERPRRFFASFLVVQQERRSTGRIDHPDSYDPPVETKVLGSIKTHHSLRPDSVSTHRPTPLIV